MDKLSLGTTNLTSDNIDKIRGLFPQVITEALDENGELKRFVDFDTLRQELSDEIVEGPKERYQFTWPGKQAAKLEARRPISKTLRPCREESVDFDTTENLYIEGDNLDALKLLRNTYAGKVKMIYIDPPYNTGNDFIYNDDYAEGITEYSERSGDYSESGGRLVTNLSSNGRFHSDWCSMMLSRLLLAKDLLRSDGVIFISIDDCEVAQLRKICDEVFGEDNFIVQLIWQSRQNKDNRNITGVSVDNEYIVCYVKTSGKRVFRGSERQEERYTNPDNDPRGPWASANMVGLATEDLRPNLHYNLINPDTGVNYGCPAKGWRYDKNTMQKLIEENRILWPKRQNGRPRKKSFLSELSEILPGFSSIIKQGIYTNTATNELFSLFGYHCFDFPKPSDLLIELLSQTTEQDDIVLDFFSGSATTAHAVIKLNANDNGNRRFILVQIPEKTNEGSEAAQAGLSNIFQIGKERIQLAGKKIKEDAGLLAANLDIGFRVLRIDSSNFEDTFRVPGETFQESLSDLAGNKKIDRSPEDLLFEVLPAFRIPLSAKIDPQLFAGKLVFSVNDGQLLACFDTDVTTEVVEEIAKQKPVYAVFRDASFANDSASANFEELFKTYSPDTVRKVV